MCALFSLSKLKRIKKIYKWSSFVTDYFQKCFQAVAQNTSEHEREVIEKNTQPDIYNAKNRKPKSKCNSSFKFGIDCVGRSEIYTNFTLILFGYLFSLCEMLAILSHFAHWLYKFIWWKKKLKCARANKKRREREKALQIRRKITWKH